MENFPACWSALHALNQWFFVVAVFFGVLFLWQLVMAIVGLGGDAALDTQVEHSWEHESTNDAAHSVEAFKLLSVRSVLAFCTLFSWAGALYMSQGVAVTTSLIYALVWGLIAMALAALLLHALRRMAETGTMKIGSCVGSTGVVYLDIPAGGMGEVRVLCGGVMTHLKARLGDAAALKAGAPVRIVKMVGPNTVEVAADEPAASATKKEQAT